ncbi:hypothetical protein [Gemmatimonas sp.]
MTDTISKSFADHDLIAAAAGSSDVLCTIDRLITTTINGSIAHNLSA